MKKKYLVAVGLLVLAAATGCGKSKNEEVQKPAQVTPTATPAVTQSADLVDMEVVEEENVMGEKTSTASKVCLLYTSSVWYVSAGRGLWICCL